MATKKKLLQAAAGSAGGAAALNVEDVFSTYVYEGNGAAYKIENGINLGQSYGSGGIDTSLKSESAVIVNGDADFGYGTGDFTIELWVWINKLYDFIEIWDQRTATQDAVTASPIIYSSDSGAIFFFHSSGNRIASNNGALSEGAWNHIALTRYGGSTKLFVDGTQVGNTYFDSTNYVAPASDWSFGGSLAQGQYNLDGYVSNARVVKGTAVYTGNFTVPTGELSNITNTVLLTAQGSTPLVDNSSSSHTVTTNEGAKASAFGPFDADEAGEGGLVWVKERTALSSGNHELMDTERGTNVVIFSDLTNANFSKTNGLTSFNSNGFTIGDNGGWNNNTSDYASWTFRKAPKFFDVVTYTGNRVDTSSYQDISHNLGTTPGVIIVKETSSAENWMVYHRSISVDGTVFKLNSTDAASDFGNVVFDVSEVNSTSFRVGNLNSTNENGASYVAYLFAHNDGDGDFGPTGDQDIIKCGSFTEVNGSDVKVTLGFEPQWIMIKVTSTTGGWGMYDVMRGWTSGSDDFALSANTSNAESNVGDRWLIHPDGFTWKNTGNARDIIYIAIRRGPMAVPTDATDVFDVNTYNATGVAGNPQTTGFPVDLAIIGQRDATDTWKHGVLTRLTGAVNYLVTSSTSGEQNAGGGINIDNMTGYDFQSGAFNTASPAGMYNLNWKRAPSFFDVVAYTGNGTAGRTVSHNLGVAPEMMIVKRRDGTGSWNVYHSSLGATKRISLQLTDAADTVASIWNNTGPTDSVFSVGTATGVNGSGADYIAYLFASLDGVSKVGSYTGTGAAQNIDCGFSNGARFILIKRTDSADGWFVHDTERGIVTGNDPYLQLNTTDAEAGGNDIVDPYSAGFTVNNFSGWNASGGSYIFYAIA